MALAPVGIVKPLTLRDRLFLAFYFDTGMYATQAYMKYGESIGKPCTHQVAEVQGSRALKRIRLSGDFRAILETRGLDDIRLASEINRLLQIKKPAISAKGEVVGEYEDGQTQVRAAEMLKDVLGHSSKAEITLITDLPAVIIEVLEYAE